MIGFSMNTAGLSVPDPGSERASSRSRSAIITAPPGWPKGEPTSTYTWIDKTWPTVKA